ncbi:hypothetical protein B0H16DRAFT_1328742, partial [Mycena metata]
MKAECIDKSIEFIKKETPARHPSITAWSQTRVYVCARQGSGGRSAYQRKKNWTRKIGSKRTGCPCRLTVKTYPGTSEVLGFYKSDHTHATGDDNLKYMRLDADTRQEIENYLRKGMEPKKVLEQITRKMYRESNLDHLRSKKANRRHFVTRADIRRIQKMIEEETIRLASGDGASVLEWVNNLRAQGHFSITGMPAAWMISSNGKEVTVDFFLNTILLENPSIVPFIFMSDFDYAQLNSIRRRYPGSKLLLCWWHVLHAWQQHFSTHHHPILWELLKSWIRITDQDEFDARWVEIKAIAPDSVTEYLEKFWMKEVALWSAVYRVDRTIFDLGDTNMLVAIPHFIARHHRQAMGFEGPDLAFKHRLAVTKRADSIPRSAIQLDPETGKYIVRSQSDDEIFYEVDLDAYDCTCLSFPLIRFCKHICAVQHHFPEAKVQIPVTALIIPANSDSDDELDDDSEPMSSVPTPQEAQAETDQQAFDALAHRLDSLRFLCLTPPAVITPELRAQLLVATQALDRLDTHLSTLPEILPQVKVKVAPNQHSWPETRAVMNVAVKSKK